MTLVIDSVAKNYSTRGVIVPALTETSLRVNAGEFVSFVGPSGCGKSTLLHIVAGLETASAGKVTLGGETVRGPGAELGMVFQQHTLFPWLTVWENLRFPQTLSRSFSPFLSEAEVGQRLAMAQGLLELVQLGDAAHKYPRELSGGMQQRAALARALVAQPEVLLMDEPFGALDSQTREEMQELVLTLASHYETTTLFVTHDIDEALLLSDRVFVFSGRPGRLVDEISVGIARAERSPEIKLRDDFLAMKKRIVRVLHARSDETDKRQNLLRDLTQPKENEP